MVPGVHLSSDITEFWETETERERERDIFPFSLRLAEWLQRDGEREREMELSVDVKQNKAETVPKTYFGSWGRDKDSINQNTFTKSSNKGHYSSKYNLIQENKTKNSHFIFIVIWFWYFYIFSLFISSIPSSKGLMYSSAHEQICVQKAFTQGNHLLPSACKFTRKSYSCKPRLHVLQIV